MDGREQDSNKSVHQIFKLPKVDHTDHQDIAVQILVIAKAVTLDQNNKNNFERP